MNEEISDARYQPHRFLHSRLARNRDSGIVELTVLSARHNDGRIVVEVKNVTGDTNRNAIWYSNGEFQGLRQSSLLLVHEADNTHGMAAIAYSCGDICHYTIV